MGDDDIRYIIWEINEQLAKLPIWLEIETKKIHVSKDDEKGYTYKIEAYYPREKI